MKLLAKTAEERYQTAASVEADLRHCLAEWESHRRIEPFALGDRDVSDRLLIPEKLYGREREIDTLLACFDRIVTHLFEVANQLNRGAARLIDRDEKARVAAIDLRAGRKAKASAAYASACVYLADGMAMLDHQDWDSQYELTFGVWLERAECEFLTSNFDTAEALIEELLQRCASKVDQAAAYHLKVMLHIVKSENQQGVSTALTCLRLFGIDLPAHPTWEQVQAEYETIWQTLNGRPIESLIDLPLMTDPELQPAMRVLSVFTPAAYLTDFHLWCLLVCRLVTIGMQRGMSGASAHGYALLGFILGREGSSPGCEQHRHIS
jgi:predicted ATPase